MNKVCLSEKNFEKLINLAFQNCHSESSTNKAELPIFNKFYINVNDVPSLNQEISNTINSLRNKGGILIIPGPGVKLQVTSNPSGNGYNDTSYKFNWNKVYSNYLNKDLQCVFTFSAGLIPVNIYLNILDLNGNFSYQAHVYGNNSRIIWSGENDGYTRGKILYTEEGTVFPQEKPSVIVFGL